MTPNVEGGILPAPPDNLDLIELEHIGGDLRGSTSDTVNSDDTPLGSDGCPDSIELRAGAYNSGGDRDPLNPTDWVDQPSVPDGVYDGSIVIGDILADEIGGRRVVLIGSDTLRISRASSQALVGPALSESAVTSYLRKAMNADEAIVIGGPHPQPEQMFHLDQAVMLLHGGLAAVTRIVGPLPDAPADARRIIEAKQFLYGLRRTLAAVGYRLVDIDTSVRNVLSFEHYINAIPYVDAVSGQRTVLMPVFPSGQTDTDRQLVRRNSQALRSLGYKVIPVPTRANELNGGIHCLVNVLE